MSVADVRAFFSKVEGNSALQEKVKTVVKNNLAAAVQLAEIASAEGFHVSAADFDNAREEGRKGERKLSPEEARCLAACIKKVILAEDCCYYASASMPGFIVGIE